MRCVIDQRPRRGRGSLVGVSGDWGEVGRRIRVERARNWPTRAAFAAATGLSRRVLEDLESGARDTYLPATLAAVEVALEWEPGSCQRLADGLKLEYGNGPDMRAILDAWPRLDDGARRMLANLARQHRRR